MRSTDDRKVRMVVVELTASGPQAAEALAVIEKAFAERFGENE